MARAIGAVERTFHHEDGVALMAPATVRFRSMAPRRPALGHAEAKLLEKAVIAAGYSIAFNLGRQRALPGAGVRGDAPNNAVSIAYSETAVDPQAGTMLPPDELIRRVAGTSDPAWFVESGRRSVKDIEAALESVGRQLAGFRRILDFGCGCGRILLPMGDVVPLERITGADIDADAVDWLRPRAAGATIVRVNELPPMPFADGTFDLVYCHSVFTHLDANYQDRWLEELRRITQPGGILVVSFSGRKPFAALEKQWLAADADPAPLRRDLEDNGILFIENDGWADGPFPPYYHTTFHSVKYVREHWGRRFRALNHLACGSLGFQDFVVLERTDAAGMPEPFAASAAIPFPPTELRRLVGPTEDHFYDNPSGGWVFPEIPPALYESVFDFASGCGRQARQLMQQATSPQRYVGIDINRRMVTWCQRHLTARNWNFQFVHHGVYDLGLAPENSRQPTAPFPVGDKEFTLVNAHSIFTHLYQQQTEFYLREIARILADEGIARTTWFFFNKSGYPWLETWQNSIFVNQDDPTNAVIYDLQWFRETVRAAGLAVRETKFPGVPGHQWLVFLEKRQPSSVDRFPTDEEAADWICGATAPKRAPLLAELERLRGECGLIDADNRRLRNDAAALAQQVTDVRSSWSWRLTQPLRALASLLRLKP